MVNTKNRFLSAGLAISLILIVASCSGTAEEGPVDPESSTASQEDDAASASSDESAGSESSSEPGTLTAANNEDFADLLAGPSFGPTVEAFVDDHHMQTVVLDGYVTFVIDSEKAVYSQADVAVRDIAGESAGPVFQFSPVLLPETSPLQSSDLAVGMEVRVTGTVGSYYSFEESSTFSPERDTRIKLLVESVEAR